MSPWRLWSENQPTAAMRRRVSNGAIRKTAQRKRLVPPKPSRRCLGSWKISPGSSRRMSPRSHWTIKPYDAPLLEEVYGRTGTTQRLSDALRTGCLLLLPPEGDQPADLWRSHRLSTCPGADLEHHRYGHGAGPARLVTRRPYCPGAARPIQPNRLYGPRLSEQLSTAPLS